MTVLKFAHPARGIRIAAEEAILAGKSTQAVIDWVKLEFENARIGPSAVSQYRKGLEARGHVLPVPARSFKWGPTALARALILDGLRTKQVVAAVKADFPNSRICDKTVHSYKHKLQGGPCPSKIRRKKTAHE